MNLLVIGLSSLITAFALVTVRINQNRHNFKKIYQPVPVRINKKFKNN